MFQTLHKRQYDVNTLLSFLPIYLEARATCYKDVMPDQKKVSAHSQTFAHHLTVQPVTGLSGNDVTQSNPQQQAALSRRLRAELQRHAEASITTLRAIVDSEAIHARDKIAAARILTALAGYVAPRAKEQKGLTDSPAEMSSEDLREFIATAERELAGRAAPVNAQVDTEPDTQVTDML